MTHTTTDAAEARADLLSHVRKMQEACANYLEPATYHARHPDLAKVGDCKWVREFEMPDRLASERSVLNAERRRDQAFIRDIIHMLDGPEQRAAFATAEAASRAAYPDNTYTPYGRRSVRNLAKQLNLAEENPTVVSVINKASDEITFLRALATSSKAGSKPEAASGAGEREAGEPTLSREIAAQFFDKRDPLDRSFREIAHNIRRGRYDDQDSVELVRFTLAFVARKAASLPPATDPAMGLDTVTIERCAKVADRMATSPTVPEEANNAAWNLAIAIRALAPTKGDVS